MADQLRGLAGAGARADSVNLDNLFDFLADVPAQRGAPDGEPDARQPTIAEIGASMERLADDLHHEVHGLSLLLPGRRAGEPDARMATIAKIGASVERLADDLYHEVHGTIGFPVFIRLSQKGFGLRL